MPRTRVRLVRKGALTSGVAAAVVALALAASAEAATVTVGRVTLTGDPPTSGVTLCSGGAQQGYGPGCTFSLVQTARGSSTTTIPRVPNDGAVTTWRVKGYLSGDANSSATWTLTRLTRNADGSFNVVSSSPAVGPSAANGSAIALATPLIVQAGDYLGVTVSLTAPGSYTSASVGAASAPGAMFTYFYSTGMNDYSDSELYLNADVVLDPPQASLSPASGSTAGGETVTLTGDHLTGTSAVSFGGAAASQVTVKSDTEVTAVTPAHAAGDADVSITTPGGTSSAGHYTFVTPTPAATPTPSATPAAPKDTTAPVLSQLLISPSSFIAANTGPAFTAAVGGDVVYRLSEPATTTFGVERKASGIKRGGRCVARPRHPRKGTKKCIRYTKVKGSFVQSGAAGLNGLRFMGRLNGKALTRGSYRLTAVAVDAASNRSAIARHPFRIRR